MEATLLLAKKTNGNSNNLYSMNLQISPWNKKLIATKGRQSKTEMVKKKKKRFFFLFKMRFIEIIKLDADLTQSSKIMFASFWILISKLEVQNKF